MRFEKALAIAAAICGTCLGAGAIAADPSPEANAPGVGSKTMQMDEPMSTTKMMKPGMKKGDVKKDADEKLRAMKPVLDKEEKSMAQEKPK